MQLSPRQLGVFWPTYFMLAYVIVGLWIGPAFVAIGLSITALALLGYFYAGAGSTCGWRWSMAAG